MKGTKVKERLSGLWVCAVAMFAIAPAAAILAALGALPTFAAVELGAPFTDGAVLQRGVKVPVWGAAASGETVEVSFAGQTKSAVADAEGRWRVALDPLAASKEGRILRANGAEARDVLVGEVWIASGQSNMDCPLWGGNPRYRDGFGALVGEMTRLPCVRYAKMRHGWSAKPSPAKVTWRKMTADCFRRNSQISAVGFYFARELYLALDVPVGLVDASYGGTPIEPWIPRSGYEASKDPLVREIGAMEIREKGVWTKERDAKYTMTSEHKQPTVLFNAMVSALVPMAIRGFIWYQGCSNWDGRGYCAKMHALLDGWSREFENPALKLYFAQLASYESNWTDVTAEQDRFVAEEPRAGMAVATDLGNYKDIHPNRKEAVAKRLVVHALRRDYGFDIAEDCSPVFRKAEYREGAAHLSFDHVKSWYVYSPDRSIEPPFQLAGTNGVWHAAKLRGVSANGIVTNGVTLVVSSEAVPEPVNVRYLYENQTAGTLYNEVSLPVGPFKDR